MSTSGGSGGGGVRASTVTFAGAAISDYFATPLVLVPAPGAGRYVLPVEFGMGFTYANGWWAGTPGLYFDDSAGLSLGGVSLSGLIGTANPPNQIQTARSADLIAVNAGFENLPVVMTDQSGANSTSGPIGSTTLNDGGVGYVPGDTGTVDGGAGSRSASYAVLTVGALGVVLTYSITDAGDGYQAPGTVSTSAGGSQPGIGTGLVLDLSTLSPITSTVSVTTIYRIITIQP